MLVFGSTGVGPFGTGSPAALLLRAADTAPQLDAVPETLRPMVELCLAKDPSVRPSAAAVLTATLPSGVPPRHAARRPPLEVTARPTGSRTGSASRRTGWLMAVGVAVVIATTATVVAVGSSTGAAPTVAAPPSAPARASPVQLTFADDVRDVAFSPDNRRAFVAHGAGLDVIDTATDTVTVTGMVARQSPRVVILSPDGTRAYVGLGNGYVQVLDTATFRSLTSIATGTFPVAIAVTPDGRRLYIASQKSGLPITVIAVDTATNLVTSTATIEGIGPTALAMSGDGSRLFVETPDEVVVVATSDSSVSLRRPTEAPDIAPAPGAQAYLTDATNTLMMLLDESGRTRDRPTAWRCAQVHDLASSSDGRHLYLLRGPTHDERESSGPFSRLEVVDTATGKAARTILVSKDYHISTVRVSPDGNQLYIMSMGEQSIDVIRIAD